MRILFLNPNSSEEITETFREAITARIIPTTRFDVKLTRDAPEVISSASDNQKSQTLITAAAPELLAHYEKVVLMSSVDTGFEALHDLAPLNIVGFTRAVLTNHVQNQRPLQLITFDQKMTPLYEDIIQKTRARSWVLAHEVIDMAPAAIASQKTDVATEVAQVCKRMANRYNVPIFIVGAVGIRIADQLRNENSLKIVDPINDLLDQLRVLKKPL